MLRILYENSSKFKLESAIIKLINIIDLLWRINLNLLQNFVFMTTEEKKNLN